MRAARRARSTAAGFRVSSDDKKSAREPRSPLMAGFVFPGSRLRDHADPPADHYRRTAAGAAPGSFDALRPRAERKSKLQRERAYKLFHDDTLAQTFPHRNEQTFLLFPRIPGPRSASSQPYFYRNHWTTPYLLFLFRFRRKCGRSSFFFFLIFLFSRTTTRAFRPRK